MTTREKRTNVAQHTIESRALEARNVRDDLARERAFGRLRELTFSPRPPPALRSYAAGQATPMSVVRVATVDKLAFEELRFTMRQAFGFPITQPGAFAAVTSLARRRRGELLRGMGRELA